MVLLRITAIGITVGLLLAGTCVASLNVVTSIHPVSAILGEIGGDRVAVTTLVPAGADPHHFELTPRKARAIYEADVIFLIGGHFDSWVLPGDSEDPEELPVVTFSQGFSESLLSIGTTFNPHFWLDPVYAGRMGEIIRRTLCSLDTANCTFYTGRARMFAAEIDSLDASISDRLDRSGFKDFVAFHPAWTYFARRYGLREHGTLEFSHEHEPSARHIAEIVREMASAGVSIIVVEEFSNADLAEAVASQTGSRIIYLDPLGGADKPGRNTYSGLMDHNVTVIENSVWEE
jgi:zinc transport system substrate-binding protein